MSQTSRKRRHFPVPTPWPQAGNDPSRPSHRARRSLSSLIGSQRLPRCPLDTNLATVQMHRPHSLGVTSIPELGTAIKSP
jgi:hypothetical protein